MKKFLSFLIFTLSFCQIMAQDFQKALLTESVNYLKKNQTKKLRETYPKLYFAYIKDNAPQYKNAVNDLRNNRFQSSVKNIDSLIQDDIFLDEVSTDKNFVKLHSLPEWKAMLKTISEKKAKYNDALRQDLKKIQNEDQGIRILYLAIDKKEPDYETLNKRAHDEMKFVDNRDAILVQKIIDRYGWLGKDEIGSEANQTLFLTVQHVDDLIVQDKYLPILQKAVKEKKAEPWHLAYLTDRIRMNQGKKQVYGSQVIHYKDSGKSFVVPIENPDKVDELRKEVGLEPLDDYLKEQGLRWNLEEYQRDLPENEKLYNERKLKNQPK